MVVVELRHHTIQVALRWVFSTNISLENLVVGRARFAAFIAVAARSLKVKRSVETIADLKKCIRLLVQVV